MKKAKDKNELGYQVLISEEGLKKINKYKENLAKGLIEAGSNLVEAILSKFTVIKGLPLNFVEFMKKEKDSNEIVKTAIGSLNDYEFIECFLQSREEVIMAEQEAGKLAVTKRRWTKEEVQLSALMSLAMQVEVYDNGERESPAVHDKPFNALMAYVSGPLNRDYADKYEIADDQKFYQLIEERLLPVFAYFNQELKTKDRKGFITSPLLGCGYFDTDPQKFYETFKKFLTNHASKFEQIQGVYLDDFEGKINEGEVKEQIENITLIKGSYSKSTERKAPLLNPEIGNYGEEFKDCMLCNLVAWDPLSREGNEGRSNTICRPSDDPAKLRATNTLAITLGEDGSYDQSLKSFKLAREVEGETIFTLQNEAGNKRKLLQANVTNTLIFNKAGKPLPPYLLKDYGFLGVYKDKDKVDSGLDKNNLMDFIVVDPAGSAFLGDNGDLAGKGASGALYNIFNKRPTYSDEDNQNTQEFRLIKEVNEKKANTKKVTLLMAGEAVFNDTYAGEDPAPEKPWAIIHAVGPNAKEGNEKNNFEELLTTTLKNVFFHYYKLTMNYSIEDRPGLRIPLISASNFLGDIKKEDYYKYFKTALEKGYNEALKELNIDKIDFGKRGIEVCCYGKEVRKAFEASIQGKEESLLNPGFYPSESKLESKPRSKSTQARTKKEKLFGEYQIEGGQISRAITKPSSSPIPIVSIRSGFVDEDYSYYDSRHLTGSEVKKDLSPQEIAEKSRLIAQLILDKSRERINRENPIIGSENYWPDLFKYFTRTMNDLNRENINSNQDAGSKVGFTAWSEDIKKNLRTLNPEADNESIEGWMNDFKLISKTIQEEAANYFGSALGRKYPEIGKAIGARSYRIIQLLDEGNALKFQPAKSGRAR